MSRASADPGRHEGSGGAPWLAFVVGALLAAVAALAVLYYAGVVGRSAAPDLTVQLPAPAAPAIPVPDPAPIPAPGPVN